MIRNSYELYRRLEPKNLLANKPPMWWPNYGSFEVIVGAILTQNSQWTRVENSLKNLQGCLDIESLCAIDIVRLEGLIQPSGLFKSKAKYLKHLACAIKEEFGSFEHFCAKVSREWLLSQKGIGPETADSILCYACQREAMVVDAYTARLLHAFGYNFESYDDLQAWCMEGFSHIKDKAERSKTYALFHAMIVEFVKANSKGKQINIKSLNNAS